MIINVNQVGPLDNYAGLQQTINVDQTNPAASIAAASAINPLTGTTGTTPVASSTSTPSTFFGLSIGIWIFIAVGLYVLFHG